MQDKINALKIKWQEEEKKHGVVIEDYEKLYEFNMLYAEAYSHCQDLKEKKKLFASALAIEYKKTVKSEVEVERLVRTNKDYITLVESIAPALKDYLILEALSTRIQGRIESKKAQEIKTNIEKKATINSGLGGQ